MQKIITVCDTNHIFWYHFMIPKCYNAGREVLHMKKDRRIAFNILTSLLSIMNQNAESHVDCELLG